MPVTTFICVGVLIIFHKFRGLNTICKRKYRIMFSKMWALWCLVRLHRYQRTSNLDNLMAQWAGPEVERMRANLEIG